MQKTASLLLYMACICPGHVVQASASQVRQTLPSSDDLRNDADGSSVIATSTHDPLKAMASLILAFNPTAAFNLGIPSGSSSLLRKAAVERRLRDVKSQFDFNLEDGEEPDYPQEWKDMIAAQKALDDRGILCREKIGEKNIYFVGIGRRKDSLGEYMASRYFEREMIMFSDFVKEHFPAASEGFKYSNPNKRSLRECITHSMKDVSMLSQTLMDMVEEDFTKNMVFVCWEGIGTEADMERMRKNNGIIVNIKWRPTVIDVPLPPEGGAELMKEWGDMHEKADITIDIHDPEEEINGWRPDIQGSKIVEAIIDFINDPKTGALRTELGELKKSELRKRAKAEGVTDEQLDAADDADDAKAALIDLIVEKATSADETSKDAQVRALKKSEMRKRALAAGATDEELDEADDSEDPKESFVQLIKEKEGW